MISYTLYAGAKNEVPIEQDAFTDWQDAVSGLAELVVKLPGLDASCPVKAQKASMLAIAPHRLSRPHRCAESVEAVTLLVIDVDRCDLYDLALALDRSGFAAVIYGSPSDDETAEVRRVRVIAPITREILPSECYQTRFAFAEMLDLAPGCGVEGAIEAAKLFFIGRLHNTPEREWLEFEGLPVDVDALLARPLLHAWRNSSSEASPAAERSEKPATARAEALAASWPGSYSGQGDAGVNALRLANSLARILGPDREEIVRVMDEHWNPACPPNDQWSQAELAHKADTAVRRYLKDVVASRWDTRRLAAEMEEPEPKAEVPYVPEARDLWAPTWNSWDAPDEPVEYYCEGLRLGPSDGKISLIAGQPGGAKGPLLDHIAVCFAIGAPVFGSFDCTRKKVLLLDFEGHRLTRLRCRRMARAMGREPSELNEWLDVKAASEFGDICEPEFVDHLRTYCTNHGVDVIGLDSYTSAMMRAGIDYNSAQYALLAQLMGGLGKLVIAVAHANKASAKGGAPSLSDVAYSGALASLAYTAITVHHPNKEQDENLVRVQCARAPEESFQPFDVRFTGEAKKGEPLAVALVTPETKPAVDSPEAKVLERRAPEVKAKLMAAAKHADRIEVLLQADTMRAGVTANAIRQALGLSGSSWAEASAECLKRGTLMTMVKLPSDKAVKYKLTGIDPPATVGQLPAVGSIASVHSARKRE